MGPSTYTYGRDKVMKRTSPLWMQAWVQRKILGTLSNDDGYAKDDP